MSDTPVFIQKLFYYIGTLNDWFITYLMWTQNTAKLSSEGL